MLFIFREQNVSKTFMPVEKVKEKDYGCIPKF